MMKVSRIIRVVPAKLQYMRLAARGCPNRPARDKRHGQERPGALTPRLRFPARFRDRDVMSRKLLA